MAGADPFVPLSSPISAAERERERGEERVAGGRSAGEEERVLAAGVRRRREAARADRQRQTASEAKLGEPGWPTPPTAPSSLPSRPQPTTTPSSQAFPFPLTPSRKMSAQTEETKQPAQVTDMEHTEEARFIVPEYTVKQCVRLRPNCHAPASLATARI
jgi:hypothetical protein